MRRRIDVSMSAAVFEVPVVFQDLPRHETYAQLCTSLASLVDASDRIFTSLNDRLDLERGACVCHPASHERASTVPDADVPAPYAGRLGVGTARTPMRSQGRGQPSERLSTVRNPNTPPRERCLMSTEGGAAAAQPQGTPHSMRTQQAIAHVTLTCGGALLCHPWLCLLSPRRWRTP